MIPTPQAVPPPISIGLDLWDSVPAALSYWQWVNALGIGTVIQVVLIVVLIYLGVRVFVGFIKGQASRDAEA